MPGGRPRGRARPHPPASVASPRIAQSQKPSGYYAKMGALLRPLRFCLHRSSSSSSSSPPTYETADNRDGDILLEGESDEEWEPSRDEIFEPPYSDSEASSSDSENDSAKRSRSHTAFGKFFFTRASLPSDLPVPGVLKRRKKQHVALLSAGKRRYKPWSRMRKRRWAYWMPTSMFPGLRGAHLPFGRFIC